MADPGRDYDLTEAQQAVKAKYPPIQKKYEYLDHTADVQLHAWGDTLEEAFEQCAMAMFGYMTYTETVEPLDTVKVEAEGHDMHSLLFNFLNEWLYKFSAEEFFIPREVKVLHIDRINFRIRSIGFISLCDFHGRFCKESIWLLSVISLPGGEKSSLCRSIPRGQKSKQSRIQPCRSWKKENQKFLS